MKRIGTIPSVRHSAGLTIIEMLVYITLLAVFTAGVYAAYYRCLDHSVALARNAENILDALRAGEQWREDIRTATAQPRLTEKGARAALHIPHGRETGVYFFATTRCGESAMFRKRNSRFLRGFAIHA